MNKEALKPPPKEKWATTWSDRQARLIHSIALGNIKAGYPDMLSAWRAAESHLGGKKNLMEARNHGRTADQ